jgi:hypothetical protein
VPFSCQILIKNLENVGNFSKSPTGEISIKKSLIGVVLLQVDRQTNMRDEANNGFSQLFNECA